eukprot:m51a1_g10932 hypothetical protein (841) ;mRNA; f:140423-143884
MCRCGKFVVPGRQDQSGAGAVPLTGLAFDVRVLDFCVEVTVRQRFHNRESSPLEASFEFILEDGATVTRFAAHVGDKVIEATLKEKEQARDTYDNALASGSGAYMLERSDEHKDAFKVSVGALPAGQEVLVELSYVTEAEALPGDGVGAPAKGVRLVLPGGALTLGVALPGSHHAALFPSPYTIRSSFEMSSIIKGVSSPSHTVSFSWSDAAFGTASCKALVTHSADAPASDGRDFVLEVVLQEPNKSRAMVAKDAQGNAVAMLTFCPNLQGAVARSELVFLLDRSGSMAGSPMNHLRSTMQLILRSMRVGTLFNIIGFGSSHSSLWSTSVEYSDATLQQAVAHVEAMQADLGGTNILAPLEAILESPGAQGVARQLFVLTDGQVEDRDECIDVVRNHASSTRVFTFGIGSGADTFLVHGLAQAGNGKCELVQGSSTLSQQVMRQLTSAWQPAITDLALNWGPVKAQQAPHVLPQLFNGSRLIVYGFLDAGSVPGPVTLSGRVGTQSINETVNVSGDVSSGPEAQHILKLAAKTALRDLEENNSFLGSGASPETAKKTAVTMSLRYGVLCKHTAFVAVEKRAGAASGESMFSGFFGSAPAPAAAFGVRPLTLMDIITKQTASGYWPLETIALLGLNWEAVSQGLPREAAGKPSAALLWVTHIVIAYIRQHFASSSIEWSLVVDKALAWAAAEDSRQGSGSKLSCRQNHPLVLFSTLESLLKENQNYANGCVCDCCAKPSQVPIMHCSACQFDMCQSCAPKCPAGHVLQLTSTAQLGAGNPAYAQGFICDRCTVQKTEGSSLHCGSCNYDICAKCSEATASTAAVDWQALARKFVEDHPHH